MTSAHASHSASDGSAGGPPEPLQSLKQRLAKRLEAVRAAGLHRKPPLIASRPGSHVIIDGQRHVNFASNDYLGLGTCPDWQATVSGCFAAYAPSASSSRLVTGNLAEIEAMETVFAARFGYAECLFFPSGYQANAAVVAGLLGDTGAVFYDRRIHASMAHALPQDGPLLTGYAHGDMAQLDRKLAKLQTGLPVHKGHQPVVLTESLFSMDGDVLDMPRFRSVTQQHGAFTVVDEAHAIGALGHAGLGVTTHAACGCIATGQSECAAPSDATRGADIVVGTLGKALGLFGAFVLMPQGFKEYLTNFAAPVIYSTAMPPAFAACACAAVDRVAEMNCERAHLAAMGTLLRSLLQDGLALSSGASAGDAPAHERPQFPPAAGGMAHIIAVEVGDEARAIRMAQMLYRSGLLVFAARYPTVPQGRAMLRISLTAKHTEEDVRLLADGIRNAACAI